MMIISITILKKKKCYSMAKDYVVVNKIIDYCQDIHVTVKRFGDCKQTFLEDRDYFNSVCMSILQIGELTNHLNDEVKLEISSNIPWRSIKGIRNVFAHNYGKVDPDLVWETVHTDIITLKNACEHWINNNGR